MVSYRSVRSVRCLCSIQFAAFGEFRSASSSVQPGDLRSASRQRPCLRDRAGLEASSPISLEYMPCGRVRGIWASSWSVPLLLASAGGSTRSSTKTGELQGEVAESVTGETTVAFARGSFGSGADCWGSTTGVGGLPGTQRDWDLNCDSMECNAILWCSLEDEEPLHLSGNYQCQADQNRVQCRDTGGNTWEVLDCPRP